MIRRIIQIDEEKCNGCGACARACHEGAIAMVDGKAKLMRDDYCDGLGDCLPACPANAIRFVEREAAPYDEAAVQAAKRAGGCSDGAAQTISTEAQSASRLGNWPVQIQLAPIRAPYFDGAHLLIAADCTAYAFGNFHERFIRGRATLIGCPKLDGINYAEKLSAILASNEIQSVTLTRMQVPCCGNLERMLRAAIENSGRHLALEVVTIAMDGGVLSTERTQF